MTAGGQVHDAPINKDEKYQMTLMFCFLTLTTSPTSTHQRYQLHRKHSIYTITHFLLLVSGRNGEEQQQQQ